MEFKSIYDIQQLLKRFGTIMYIGDRVLDLKMMELELRELFQSQLIETRDYQTALLLLRQETQKALQKKSN
ncbi:YqgQ family protein [Jeotgalibacillus soli]|uniref:Cytosolic protein n=1 Tax=Jeotgalibacillus soli TaxID=889306 RepID=A0A0C2RRM0_9BACL|nr:YqgQ family protein [Jeotgalibacillus soli]KIL44399.1 hypothetical protein KP78_33630 [Jeotgalibacillus soli]